MPYVAKALRTELDAGRVPFTPGELNYRITMTVLTYIHNGGRQQTLIDDVMFLASGYLKAQGLSYASINDVVGALHCASMELLRRTRNCGVEARLLAESAEEFYQRVAAPYEDGKVIANGDLPYAEACT